MRSSPIQGLATVVCLVPLVLSACGVGETPSERAIPIIDLVEVRPFTLEEGFQYDWRLERPLVRSGTVAVLKVDPDLVVPRNDAERILYVGDQTAQRLNHGHDSGHLIVLIPGDVELVRAPIWFGSPGLPERVTADTIRSERAQADEAGIRPFPEAQIRELTGDPLRATNLAALLREHVADLVLTYSPQERDLAASWRLPIAQ